LDQKTKAERFHELHQPGAPLVLTNVWDAGSARAVEKAGAAALATGSWSIAAANGFADGEKIPVERMLEVIARIAAATALPLSADLESGYGAGAPEVRETIRRAIAAGAIGCNLEDSFPADGRLREVADQVQRIAAARAAAEAEGFRFFLNARTDVFFQKAPEYHDGAMVEEALERARAYAAAGADGLFVPGLVDLPLIAELTRHSPLPVNIMRLEASLGIGALVEAGVARISHGPAPYLQAMGALEAAAREALAEWG
jgi:2-methylisocitrate lyase-like PEP mutase family enzyme